LAFWLGRFEVERGAALGLEPVDVGAETRAAAGARGGKGSKVGPSGSAPCGFRSDAVAEGNFGFGAGTKRIPARD
jgi:hypothetical protein